MVKRGVSLVVLVILVILICGIAFAAQDDFKEFAKDKVKIKKKDKPGFNTTPNFNFHAVKKIINITDPGYEEGKISFEQTDPPTHGIHSFDLYYKNDSDLVWTKGKPRLIDPSLSINDSSYESIYFDYADDGFWVYFWTDHLTNFYTNGTNYTSLTECLVAQNGTGNTCYVIEDDFHEVINGSGTYYNVSVGIVGEPINIPDFGNRDNVFIDFNGSTLVGGSFYLNGRNFTNITVQNLTIVDGSFSYNPSTPYTTYNSTVKNVDVINSSASNPFTITGDNIVIENILSSGYSGVYPAVYLFGNGYFHVDGVTITDNVGDGACMALSGSPDDSYFNNVYIADGCNLASALDAELSGTSDNITFQNWYVENIGINDTEWQGDTWNQRGIWIRPTLTGTLTNLLLENFTVVNSSLVRQWLTNNFAATYNETEFGDVVMLAQSDGIGVTYLHNTVDTNIDVSGIGSGKPFDGADNYSLCLIRNATYLSIPHLNMTILVKDDGGLYSRCAGLVAATGGILEVNMTPALTANGYADYSLSPSVWSNITFANPFEITYNSFSFDPYLDVSNVDGLTITNSTFIIPNGFINGQAITGESLVVIEDSTDVDLYDNVFTNGNVTDPGSTVDYCVNGVGNFYTYNAEPDSTDCGPSILNNTDNVIGDNYTFNWTAQDIYKGLTITYNVIFDLLNVTSGIASSTDVSGDQTDTNFTLDTGTLADARYYARIVPSINLYGDTYNATTPTLLTAIANDLFLEIFNPYNGSTTVDAENLETGFYSIYYLINMSNASLFINDVGIENITNISSIGSNYFSAINLTPNKAYNMTVVTTDQYGNEDNVSIWFTTGNVDVEITSPQNGTNGSSTVTVTFDTDYVAGTYNATLYVDNVSTRQITSYGSGSTSFGSIRLGSSTTYTLSVSIVDAYGNTDTDSVSFTTTANGVTSPFTSGGSSSGSLSPDLIPLTECDADSDCADNQYCSGSGNCITLTCDDSVNHKCPANAAFGEDGDGRAGRYDGDGEDEMATGTQSEGEGLDSEKAAIEEVALRAQDCSLFGINHGAFVICWYWWALLFLIGCVVAIGQSIHISKLRYNRKLLPKYRNIDIIMVLAPLVGFLPWIDKPINLVIGVIVAIAVISYYAYQFTVFETVPKGSKGKQKGEIKFDFKKKKSSHKSSEFGTKVKGLFSEVKKDANIVKNDVKKVSSTMKHDLHTNVLKKDLSSTKRDLGRATRHTKQELMHKLKKIHG